MGRTLNALVVHFSVDGRAHRMHIGSTEHRRADMARKPPAPADLTASEARTAITALRDIIGPRADITAALTFSRFATREGALYASVYPTGLGRGDQAFTVTADDWRGLVAALGAKWAEFSDEHVKRIIREMALEIIRITADQGECTDAALRAGRYTAEEVRLYGERACADATEIAGLGPFSIVTIGGANQAEAA
jgi:hypothetical protein